MTQTKTRDFLFDNLRAVLIFCVIFGHLLTPLQGKSTLVRTLYDFLFFFHMPAFIFISGYFSKNTQKCRDSAFESFLIPYMLFNLLSYLFDGLRGGNISLLSYKFLTPQWGMWFLLAMFTFRFFLKDLSRIRLILPLSFAVGLACGLFKEFGTFLALGRILGFLPFFLLGYFTKETHLEKLRRFPKLLAALLLSGSAVLAFFCAKYNWISQEDLFLRKAYPADARLENLLIRFGLYALAVLLIAALIVLFPKRQTFLSRIGQNTLTAYLLHLFIVPVIKSLKLFQGSAWMFTLFSLIVAMVLTWVLSLPVLKRWYDAALGWICKGVMREKV